jgi:hypothetical protein
VLSKTIVEPRSTNRRALSWLTFVLLGLALSVFTWGLQYKLSLYDPPNAASHEMPEAKLLSKSERITATENPLLKNIKAPGKIPSTLLTSVFLLFLLAASSLNIPVSDQRRREEKCPLHWRRLASLNPFFFRPPPALA